MAAAQTIHRIKKQMWEKVPYERWKFEWHPLQDKSGYGIWVTYQGEYSREEYQLEAKERAERSAAAKERWARTQLKKSLQPKPLTTQQITRPRPR